MNSSAAVTAVVNAVMSGRTTTSKTRVFEPSSQATSRSQT